MRFVRCLGVVWLLIFSATVHSQDKTADDLRDAQLDWVRSARPELGREVARSPSQDASSPALEVNAGTAHLWAISLQDKTLYRVMRRWAAQAQYQLVWQIDRDFPIESEVVFEGSFRKAVAEVMSGVSMTDYPLQAVFNMDTRVLRVVRFLEERSGGLQR
jgi:predicted transcriptional regulator